jgi:hypothetical protein
VVQFLLSGARITVEPEHGWERDGEEVALVIARN